MGGKISIDSATLMNKGLEVIEAYHLFGIPYDRIDVVVHPQSIVHCMITLCDGAALAHLGHPDMGVPISYALHHPDRVDVPLRRLDLAEVGALTFEPVDHDAFPCLGLARAAAIAGGTAPCVLNAANEIAVHAFLQGRLGFLGIAAVIERTLEALPPAARARVRVAVRGRSRGRDRAFAIGTRRGRRRAPGALGLMPDPGSGEAPQPGPRRRAEHDDERGEVRERLAEAGRRAVDRGVDRLERGLEREDRTR